MITYIKNVRNASYNATKVNYTKIPENCNQSTRDYIIIDCDGF
jgi:hypothetical protein